MKFLFLYTELGGYTADCFKHHLKRHPEDEIHVVHYPVNREAPFQFEDIERLVRYERHTLDHEDLFDLVKEIDPQLILSSGWVDKGYLKVLRMFKGSIPNVLCFDNHWTGKMKQRLLLIPASLYLKKIFDYAWVPGAEQRKYAMKLGFSKQRVFEGFYAADTAFFSGLAEQYAESKRLFFPKRFLTVARYVPQKGLDAMWDAFNGIPIEERNGWELWCAGTGELWDERSTGVGITHLGFVQPQQMDAIVAETGVFILPSIWEPWGVAVHEFAAAGYPLVLSKAVGSGSAFLEDGKNGFLVQGGSPDSIRKAMKKIMRMTPEELQEMGTISMRKASKISTDTWSDTLIQLAELPTNKPK